MRSNIHLNSKNNPIWWFPYEKRYVKWERQQSFTIATGIMLYNTCDGQLISCLLHGSVRKRKQHGPGLPAGPWVSWCPLTPLPLCRFWISTGVTKQNSYKTWGLFGQYFPQFKVHEIMRVFICCLADLWDFSPKLMIFFHTLMCRIRTCVSLESTKTVWIVLEDCTMEKKLYM